MGTACHADSITGWGLEFKIVFVKFVERFDALQILTTNIINHSFYTNHENFTVNDGNSLRGDVADLSPGIC